jgi:hypothetical protein
MAQIALIRRPRSVTQPVNLKIGHVPAEALEPFCEVLAKEVVADHVRVAVRAHGEV